MKKIRMIGASGILSVLIACSGAVPWQDSCGCMPIGSSLMGDLKWSELPYNTSLAPGPVAHQVKSLLAKADPSKGTLQNLRSFGNFSNSVCFERSRDTYRCTYWLWESGENHRGIQVDVVGSNVSAMFVREIRENSSGS